MTLAAILLLASVAATSPDAGSADKEPASKEVKKKKRFRFCGCARPRLLRDAKEIILDAETALSAFTEPGKVEFGTFQSGKGQVTESVPVPFVIETFDYQSYGDPVPTKSALQRVIATNVYDDPFLLGLLRSKSNVAADVVRARVDLAPGERYMGKSIGPPKLLRLWLSPFVDRMLPSCGPSQTHRVHFELAEESPKLAGFVVVLDGKAALIDERHARSYGIGRVEPCDQGLPVSEDAARTIDVYAVGWDFEVSERFRFKGLAGEHPRLVESPGGIDDDEEKNPFLHPPKDPLEHILSDDSDNVALGAMLFIVFGAGTLAAILWRVIRKKKIIEVLNCPSCDAEIEMDLSDKKTDGMFCPSCGKASVFVTIEPDGTPRARVYKLGDDDDT